MSDPLTPNPVRPLCFMIMPFGRKATQAEAGKGPAEIDFNALWDRAYVPVIKVLGYDAVRADQDTGALIVTQMFERLYFADLVLADMTIPNGNVYYEVGIRHAARRKGCVLLAADWSRQLFDVMQMRTVRYPLPEGEITEATAQQIGAVVKDAIVKLKDGLSPMYELISGYPSNVDERSASAMKDQMASMAAFQGQVRAVRAAPPGDRMRLAKALVAKFGVQPILPSVALGLILMLRECVDTANDWNQVLAFIDTLPPDLAEKPDIKEHRAFALAYSGRDIEAIGALEAVVGEFGPSPERLGLLGGRYKRLNNLPKAIDCYERGMELDLNDYYCVSNLGRLYRARNRKGDEDRAKSALTLTIAACERAKARGSADEWLRQTLLGAAFDLGDVEKAEELADQVADEGAARWKIKSTLDSLAISVTQISDPEHRARMKDILASLQKLAVTEGGALSSVG
jgi:MAP3K TRAFs-binding domain